MGKYAGGKSKVMETLQELSIEGTVTMVTGSSSLGALPIYTDRPVDDVLFLYDELPPIITQQKRGMTEWRNG